MENNVKEERKKKALLVLPLIVVPFITLGFWAAGGGSGNTGGTQEDISGFNLNLPEVKKEEKPMDMLSYYKEAEKDSIRLNEMSKRDPYYSDTYNLQEYNPDFNPYSAGSAYDYTSPATPYDRNEKQVYEKLDQLNKVLGDAQKADEPAQEKDSPGVQLRPELSDDVARLEQMMLMMQGGANASDPEMDQINQTLETILDIQHPERVQERIRQQSKEHLGQVFSVSTGTPETPITSLDRTVYPDSAEPLSISANPQNRFYGLAENTVGETDQHNAIRAVVHETQTVVTGSTVKLRLLDDVYINGVRIAKDNFIVGTANLRGERLELTVESIRADHSLFPVKLAVHDMDGLAGIHIPGAITRDAAKQSGDQAINSMNLGMFNPSLGAQAASAGIELGRNLLSRKIKLVKVQVKAGYQVLLRDEKKKEY